MGTSSSKDETDQWTDDVNFTPRVLPKDRQKKPGAENNPAASNGVSNGPIVDDSTIASHSTLGSSVTGASAWKQAEKSEGAEAGSGKGGSGSAPEVQLTSQSGSGNEESAASAKTGSTAASSTAMSATGPAGASAAPEETRTLGGSSQVLDNDVQVNLAMADLMAYLQVVANNSANLPLTRRDDPELGRTVSTLTADEYARKSAAFIPSDVRIIGGTFTRYGKVWDLPTSEEFSAADGAQEPGRSHGGACCNSLLKVLYDAENEAADANQGDFMNPDNLFDDDDTVITMEEPSVDSAGKSFESLVLADATTASNITWSSLLRKMKGEMQDVGHPQVPTITSSRKFDLNKPFSLVPSDFDPAKNKRRSLLIGCNYNNLAGAELKASHDDIRSVKDFIVNVHGFPEKKGLMTVLLDDNEHKHPTHMNITEAFKSLSEQSRPGDAVFVQFSGLGGRVLDSPLDSENESYDEVLVPSDFNTTGVIRDTLCFKTLLAPMRYGVTVTILIDACDTGMMVDLPYSWTTKSDRGDSLAKMSLNDDFSFVRFLKVVKTLYESSTFTQLGKTVGSALNDKPAATPRDLQGGEEDSAGDEETLGVGSLVTVDDDEEDKGKVPMEAGRSLLKALAACTSQPKSPTPKELKTAKSHESVISKGTAGNTIDGSTVESRPSTQTLFQQVMNCTFTNPADESDEDTFHAPTLDDDEHSFDGHTVESEEGTYDSMTDGEEIVKRDTRKGKTRRSKRR